MLQLVECGGYGHPLHEDVGYLRSKIPGSVNELAPQRHEWQLRLGRTGSRHILWREEGRDADGEPTAWYEIVGERQGGERS